MLEDLKIGAKKQKRIILIFFLNILVPSIFLGIFGIRAIRNEKFRITKQLENEYRRGAEYITSQVKNSFREVGRAVQNLTLSSSIAAKDYPGIKNLLVTNLSENLLMDFVFVAYEDEEVFFPQFQPALMSKIPSIPSFEGSLLSKLKRAEKCEFELKRYDLAVLLYRELYNLSENENLKANMLACLARSQVKNGEYEKAVDNYSTVFENYKFSVNSSMQPLAILSGLQIVNCYRDSGDFQKAMKTAMSLYRNICEMTWDLTEAQFKTYCSLVYEAVAGFDRESQNELTEQEFPEEWDQIELLHQERLEQWHAMRDIEAEIIPDLRNRLNLYSDPGASPHFYAKTIDEASYLIISVSIPSETGSDSSDLIGALVDHEYLTGRILPELLENQQFSEQTDIVISDLSGSSILGKKGESTESVPITAFFESNFPPWKIEFYRSKTPGLAGIDIKKNFYFWMIVVLLIVLAFGAALIMRTIAHEMEVLKIKSDFVSSVSHEFKTPLTSIKTLIERLKAGKVEDKTKMDQYFSVIAQDTDKLTRMVGNILDFSKIEEGKREYDFVQTDLAQLVFKQVQEFKKAELLKDFSIRSIIQGDIPLLSIDKEAMSQALNNLLDNAVKFSQDHKEIKVFLLKDVENVILEVQDKGIGIPPDEWDKIFDKFYQGKNALRRTVKGAGLGLTLVKHAVEAHGGSVNVQSKFGEGSTFSLIFPIERKIEERSIWQKKS